MISLYDIDSMQTRKMPTEAITSPGFRIRFAFVHQTQNKLRRKKTMSAQRYGLCQERALTYVLSGPGADNTQATRRRRAMYYGGVYLSIDDR